MQWFWAGHLVALPFQTVTLSPLQIPIPEAVGAAFVAAAAVDALRAGRRIAWTAIDTAAAAWVGAVILGGAAAWARAAADAATARELFAAIALFAVYLAVRVSATRERILAFPRLYLSSAALAAALGIAGWLLARAGITTPLAFPAETAYLYVGAAARAQAFTTSPSMLASLLMVASVLLVAEWTRLRRWERVALTPLVVAGLALTLSKTILCAAAGAGIAWCLGREQRPAFAAALWVAVATVFTLSAHWALVRPDALAIMKRGYMVAGEPIANVTIAGRDMLVMRTNYAYSKYASVEAVRASFPIGIGPGRHGQFIAGLQAEGRYPANLWEADPHSTYTGTAAELGLAGLATLILLWGAVAWRWWTIDRRRLPDGAWAGYAGVLAAIAIEAICTDVMNFRQYWWLIAVIAVWSTSEWSASTRPSSAAA